MEIKVDDKVRLKVGIKEPHYGWGMLRYNNKRQVGVVKVVRGDFIKVDFPCQSGWSALLPELEIAPPMVLENK